MKLKKKEDDEKLVQLKELKNNLPIPKDGKKSQEFSFMNWTMEQEKEIAKLKSETGIMGKFVSAVLNKMLDTFCGEDFQAKSKEEKLVMINQLEMANIMYLWVYLRYDTMGDQIVMDISCPACGKMNTGGLFTLDTMDVTVKSEKCEKHGVYELLKPFKFNEEKVESLKISYTKWEAMEGAKDEVSANEGLMKEVIFSNSIIGFNDSEGYVETEALIQNLHKRDIECLSNMISKHNGGPTMSVEGRCQFCATKYFKHLNWGYDHFFGQSSLPDR